MKILLDTHVLIDKYSDRTDDSHLWQAIQYGTHLKHQFVVHHSSIEEIKKDKNIPDSRKRVLESKMQFYPEINLQPNSYEDKDFFEKVHKPDRERGAQDIDLLYCLYVKAVDLLLTEDSEILEKAILLGISGKVKNLRQAAESFKRALSEEKSEFSEVPVFYFYEEGGWWYIGEEGKKLRSFKDRKGGGFGRIHLLLQYKRIPSSILASEGKTGINTELLEKLAREYREDLSEYSKIEGSEPKDEMVRLRMQQLQCEIAASEAPAEIAEKKDEYNDLKKYLKQREREDQSSSDEEGRSTVTKTIQRALAKIQDDKSLKRISRHLNQTIKTGGKCRYDPSVDDTPIWIFKPNSE